MSNDRRYILLTTDFKPMTGGIAEYLGSLWQEVARSASVEVMTNVEIGSVSWEHRYTLSPLPPAPRRRLGLRIGDALAITRKMNTANYFHGLRKYAEETVGRLRCSGTAPEIFIGVWDVTSHFWCLALRRAGIPYSIHVHGLEVSSPFYGSLPSWRRADFCHAKTLFANSWGTARLIEEKIMPGLPIKVVNPGIKAAPSAGKYTAGIEELRRSLGLPREVVLLSVGRLVPRKGFDLVLQGVAELVAEFPDITYLVAGGGPDEERLRNLSATLGIDSRVRFLGEVDEPTKATFYELCDIFVMPNRILGGIDWEGFGIVFLEAALAEKPVIGGNNGGVADAVEHGVTGFLVDTDNDATETVLALRSLLSDRSLRKRMGRAARERAVEAFTWDAIGAGFLALLDEL